MSNEARANAVSVHSGANTRHITLSADEEMSVSDVRDDLGDDLNIEPSHIAYVNGNEVGDDYVLNPGDKLQFSKPSGSKG